MNDDIYYPNNEQINSEYSPSFQSQHEGTLIRWQLEFEDILSEVEHKLKGEFLNFSTGEWELRPYSKMLNDRGVAVVMQLLSTHLNKGTPLTTYTKEEINKQIFDLMNALIDILELRWFDFEIDKANLQTILSIVEGYVTTALHRSKDGVTLKFLKSAEKYTETRAQAPQQQKKNWLSLFGM